MYTELIKERDAMPAINIFPQTLNGTFINGGVIDMSLYERAVAYVLVSGTGLVQGANLTLGWQQSNNANMASASNITMVGAQTNTVPNPANITLSSEVYATMLNARYVQPVVWETSSKVTGALSMTIIATDANYKPANVADNGTVCNRTYPQPS